MVGVVQAVSNLNAGSQALVQATNLLSFVGSRMVEKASSKPNQNGENSDRVFV